MRQAIALLLCIGLLGMLVHDNALTQAQEVGWKQLTTTIMPPARYDHVLVATDRAQKLILFGGRDKDILGDTWLYDITANSWRTLALQIAPDARFGMAAAYDATRNRVLLFGGQQKSFFNDVWAFDVETEQWSKLDTTGALPTARYGTSAVIDPDNDLLIISHGFASGRFDDTFALDLKTNTWRDISPETRPLKRCLHEAVFDTKRSKTLLFGGCSSGFGPCPQGDLWSFDTSDNQWTEITSDMSPSPRSNPSLVYDPSGTVLLFGGRDGDGNFNNELWTLDSATNTWNEHKLANMPSGRSSHDAAWDIVNGQMFVFGGNSENGAMNEMWVFQSSQSNATQAAKSSLPDFGAAPELLNDVWLNTDKPLRLADLRGKVVLINFWTFGCYNCKNVLPYIRQWYDTYTDKGLVVIGIHFPEFSYEADLDNLKAAAQDLGVKWAVAQDNDGKTWRVYNQRYWPTLYLIDKRGNIRYQRIGEGAYTETEAAIQALLTES